jgi:hypothetical protein
MTHMTCGGSFGAAMCFCIRCSAKSLATMIRRFQWMLAGASTSILRASHSARIGRAYMPLHDSSVFLMNFQERMGYEATTINALNPHSHLNVNDVKKGGS